MASTMAGVPLTDSPEDPWALHLLGSGTCEDITLGSENCRASGAALLRCSKGCLDLADGGITQLRPKSGTDGRDET